jgi:GNAT superfamily N-acetyltransferase
MGDEIAFLDQMAAADPRRPSSSSRSSAGGAIGSGVGMGLLRQQLPLARRRRPREPRFMAVENRVIRRPEPHEMAAAAGVYARSLVDSLDWLRPEQRHTEAENRRYFETVVAKECDIWIAEQGGRILGVLAMNGDEIDRLYVDTELHGQGVGTLLLDHVKTLSPGGLRLVTLQGNERARRFYERHGFSAYDHGVSPAPENEPDVWYRWGNGS